MHSALKVSSRSSARQGLDRSGGVSLVKLEVEVLQTLSMDLALVRIGPGTHLSFEQARVNGEVWLPSRTTIQGDARLGYLVKMHADQEITYRDYKKFHSDSRIVTEDGK